MNPLSTCEKTGITAAAEETMLDSCKIGVATKAEWSDDPGGSTYAFGDEISCGFKPTRSGEIPDGTQVPDFDATLRLPVASSLIHIDRIRMTERFGTAISPEEDYKIEGTPRLGVSAFVVNLKRIIGTSAE